ncbi:MAG: hypothetical protein KDI44_17250 [Thiothrix sp.]|nr:hypothetical protein [Thiothrix sp.]HPQ95726.1 hypothetical protein [Thiolinea sp.]
MKLPTLISLPLLGSLALPGLAAPVTYDSIYTPLNGPPCVGLDGNEEEGWASGSCPGTGGYSLLWSEVDIRQSLDVVAPDGSIHPLELWSVVSPNFSALGHLAEWRVRKTGSGHTPVGLIVRYNVNENPEQPEQVTSYLVVSKLNGPEICVTAVIRPHTGANAEARRQAEHSALQTCRLIR